MTQNSRAWSPEFRRALQKKLRDAGRLLGKASTASCATPPSPPSTPTSIASAERHRGAEQLACTRTGGQRSLASECAARAISGSGRDSRRGVTSHAFRRVPPARRDGARRPDRQGRSQRQGGARDGYRPGRAGQSRHQRHRAQAVRSRPLRGRRRSCPAVRSRAYPISSRTSASSQKGEPATLGSSLFKDFVADHDSAYVTRCKKAGLVIMGRSSSPEFGLEPDDRAPPATAHAAIPGTSSTRPAARRAAPRQPSSPAFCPWRTPPTAAARSASRRPNAACSASSPRAGACRWHPTRARAGAGSRSATS